MFTFTTRVRIYHSIYPITESIYEIIAKYQANDDQCCLLTYHIKPIYEVSTKYQANDDPCIVLYSSIVFLLIIFF